MSPAELLFGRKIRTKLPEFHEDCVVSEVQDRGGEMKVKVICRQEEACRVFRNGSRQQSAAKTREAKQAVDTICTKIMMLLEGMTAALLSSLLIRRLFS